ncbi:MAG: radical SAM protein [Pseudonocardiaceae bacterium]
MVGARSVAEDGLARFCYFRTTVAAPHRKALVQINEDCNLRCAHCFVAATRIGQQMPLAQVIDTVIPRLADCRVRRVTLTGGEPTIHPRVHGHRAGVPGRRDGCRDLHQRDHPG